MYEFLFFEKIEWISLNWREKSFCMWGCVVGRNAPDYYKSIINRIFIINSPRRLFDNEDGGKNWEQLTRHRASNPRRSDRQQHPWVFLRCGLSLFQSCLSFYGGLFTRILIFCHRPF
jgi:hypothetical protein